MFMFEIMPTVHFCLYAPLNSVLTTYFSAKIVRIKREKFEHNANTTKKKKLNYLLFKKLLLLFAKKFKGVRDNCI